MFRHCSVIVLLGACWALGACQSEPSAWYTEPADAKGIAGTADIAWRTDPTGDGRRDIYLSVNGQGYLIEKSAKTLQPMPRRDWVAQEVPRNAHSAAYFWAIDAGEEDGQKMYVRDKGDQVVVYASYVVPGARGDDDDVEGEVGWQRKRTIGYAGNAQSEEE